MILGSEAFLDANTLQDPGSRVSGLGFWTLATLSGGDIYLYDQAEERVRMVDPCQLHSLLGKAGVALTRSSVEAWCWTRARNWRSLWRVLWISMLPDSPPGTVLTFSFSITNRARRTSPV